MSTQIWYRNLLVDLAYDILDDPSFLLLIIWCNSIEAASPVEIS